MKLKEKIDENLTLLVHEHECRFLLELNSGILNYHIHKEESFVRYDKQQLLKFSDKILQFVQKYENYMPYHADEAYYNPTCEEPFEVNVTSEDLIMVSYMIEAIFKFMPEKVMQLYTGYMKEHIVRFRVYIERIASEAGVSLE